MRILYENKLKEASLVGTSATNFGLGNMLISSLRIPYIANDASTQITIEFEDKVNCIAIAGHNLNTLRYRLYKDDNILQEKLVVQLEKTEMLYFPLVEVDKIVLNMVSDDLVKVGYLSIGEFIQMPNPDAYYDEGMVITNKREENMFGQVYASRGVTLQTYKLNFSYVKKIEKVRKMLETVRNYQPVFVDMTEDNRNYKKPLFATMNFTSFNYSRSPRNAYLNNFSLDIKEIK